MKNNDKQITPEKINKIKGINHLTTKIEGGLSGEELKQILSSINLSYKFDFFSNNDIDYHKIIYNYIESGCPVLLAFNTNSMDVNNKSNNNKHITSEEINKIEGEPKEEEVTSSSFHVVSVLGHVSNYDMWKPLARPAYLNYKNDYTSTSDWLDHFIINDDNFGMHLCLPVDALKTEKETLEKKFKEEEKEVKELTANYFIAIVPSDVKVTALKAEMSIMNRLEKIIKEYDKCFTDNIWVNRLISSKTKVIRTFLVTREEYRDSLHSKDFENNIFSEDNKIELLKIPDRFWLSEISIPDLYSANKSKIIDIIFESSYEREPSINDLLKKWIFIRFPGILFKNNVETSFIHSFPLQVKSHYPLLRFESDYEILEW